MKRFIQFDINVAEEIREVHETKDVFLVTVINACTCKEETALFPEVGFYHSVCYVLIGLGQGWCISTDVRPTVVLAPGENFVQFYLFQ